MAEQEAPAVEGDAQEITVTVGHPRYTLELLDHERQKMVRIGKETLEGFSRRDKTSKKLPITELVESMRTIHERDKD